MFQRGSKSPPPPSQTPFTITDTGFLDIPASISVNPCNLPVKQLSIFKLIWELGKRKWNTFLWSWDPHLSKACSICSDEADICRLAAIMGLIPRDSSVLQGALGNASDCQTGGPNLALFSAPALGSSWPRGSEFREQSSGGIWLTE